MHYQVTSGHLEALFTSYPHLSMALTSLCLLRHYMRTLYGLMAMECIRSCDNYMYITTTSVSHLLWVHVMHTYMYYVTFLVVFREAFCEYLITALYLAT